jgi:hypothetical protein
VFPIYPPPGNAQENWCSLQGAARPQMRAGRCA